MKIINPLLLLFFLSISAAGQTYSSSSSIALENNSNQKRKPQTFEPKESNEPKNILGLQVGITDPTFALSYERLLFKNFAAEVSAGLIGFSIGPKIYLPSLRPGKMSFYTGVIVGAGALAEGQFGYLPIGISRLTKTKFSISFDIGPHTGNVFNDTGSISPGARLRIGQAF
jgi:hypothetical protein